MRSHRLSAAMHLALWLVLSMAASAEDEVPDAPTAEVAAPAAGQ